jgi:hypothetical protein
MDRALPKMVRHAGYPLPNGLYDKDQEWNDEANQGWNEHHRKEAERTQPSHILKRDRAVAAGCMVVALATARHPLDGNH